MPDSHTPQSPASGTAPDVAAVATGSLPVSFFYPLFAHMSREHGLTLLESELAEIVSIAAPLTKQAEALQAVRDWYDRDGSVGGCDGLMEEHVEPLTVDSLANAQAETGRPVGLVSSDLLDLLCVGVVAERTISGELLRIDRFVRAPSERYVRDLLQSDGIAIHRIVVIPETDCAKLPMAAILGETHRDQEFLSFLRSHFQEMGNLLSQRAASDYRPDKSEGSSHL